MNTSMYRHAQNWKLFEEGGTVVLLTDLSLLACTEPMAGLVMTWPRWQFIVGRVAF